MNFLDPNAIRYLVINGLDGYIDALFAQQTRQMGGADNIMYKGILSRVIELIEDDKKILEMDPGPGYLSIELSKKFPDLEITALEKSKTMLSIARENIIKAEIPSDKILLKNGDYDKPVFEDESFDLIFSAHAFHNWKNRQNVIKELYRIIQKNGTIFISDTRKDMPDDAFELYYLNQTNSRIFKKFLQYLRIECLTAIEVEEIMKSLSIKNFRIDTDDAFWYLIIGDISKKM